MKRQLYHVSPRRVMGSILAHGIDPAYSQTPRNEIWLVSLAKLKWAVQHVAERHNCSPDDVVCYYVRLDEDEIVNRGNGRFTVTRVLTDFNTIRRPRK